MPRHAMQEGLQSSDSRLNKFFAESTKEFFGWERRNDDSWTHGHEAVMEPLELRESSDNRAEIGLVVGREVSVDSVAGQMRGEEMRGGGDERERREGWPTRCSSEDRIS